MNDKVGDGKDAKDFVMHVSKTAATVIIVAIGGLFSTNSYIMIQLAKHDTFETSVKERQVGNQDVHDKMTDTLYLIDKNQTRMLMRLDRIEEDIKERP